MSGNKKKADQTVGRECDGKGCKIYKASISINKGCRSYLKFPPLVPQPREGAFITANRGTTNTRRQVP